jgi:hypothetical protein
MTPNAAALFSASYGALACTNRRFIEHNIADARAKA